MTPEEAIAELRQMSEYADKGGVDIEAQHTRGDEVLCAVLRHLGHVDVAEAFEAASENWWYA